MEEDIHFAELDGLKTLPLYCIYFQLLEDMGAFSSAKAAFEYHDPNYEPDIFTPTARLLKEISQDADLAINVVSRLKKHDSNFMYYVQFKDDPDRSRMKAFHDHTEAVSILCDSRLGIDPAPFWDRFHGLYSFATVHFEYRADPDRAAKWEEYAAKLKKVYETNVPHEYMRQ